MDRNGSAGDLLARALGIRTEVFAHVAHADNRESEDAAQMQRAMWYAGWGTYLREIVNAPFGLDVLNAAHEHFSRFARARGPLPALRIGRQPYGVLPVIAMSHWSPQLGNELEAGAVPALVKLRAIWRSKLNKVPRVGRLSDPEEAREDLLHALAQQTESSDIVARPLAHLALFGILGTPFFEPEFPNDDIEERWAIYRQRESELGLMRFSRLGSLLAMQDDFPIALTLSQDALDTPQLEPNYIAWLRTATYSEIEAEDFSNLGAGDFAASPALVRSRISSRSNSARAAKIPNTNLPPAVVVSMLAPWPARTFRPIPRLDRSWTVLTR